MKKIRVVLDTNILISAIGWEGKPGKILEMSVRGEIALILSPALLNEFKDIIARPKFDFIPNIKKEEFIPLLTKLSEITIPETKLNIIPVDPKDNRVLECALAGKADYIISGDKHLLDLKTLGRIKIVSPTEFLASLRQKR